MTGDNLSDVAVLALSYLSYADGMTKMQHETQQETRHTALLDTMVRGALVASGEYEEKIVFRDYFSSSDEDLPDGMVFNDADVDLDYSDVEFGVPEESEMEILQRMLEDKTVTVSGLHGTGEHVDPALPAPRQISRADIEQDREWL